MTVGVKITVDAKRTTKLFRRLPAELKKEINNSTYNFAKYTANQLKKGALQDSKRPITPARFSAAAKIVARKQSNNIYNVMMPSSLIMLDAMKPHYVSLKRGRNITKWTKKYFTGKRVGGKSIVGFGPRGGVKMFTWYKGKYRKTALFVTPHKFVNRTLKRVKRQLPYELQQRVRKAFKASV